MTRIRLSSIAKFTIMKYQLKTLKFVVPIVLLCTTISCKKDDPVAPDDNNLIEVSPFFNSLPSWEIFADNPPELEPTPTGEVGQMTTETLDVPIVQDDGTIDTLYNVTYSCEQKPYTMAKNPEQIVMYDPDREILWPGALIQGKSHKNSLGSLLGLTIAERTPIEVSIPDLPTGTNFRRVVPSQAVVESAIGEMRGDAVLEGLSTPSTINFKMESYRSEKQMALSMGLSGKYLSFSASASGDFSRNQSETTVTVQFYQKMYTVVVAPPQTPSSFFSEEFTPEKLKEQRDLGRMGPDNLPVYVSSVVYGRMMMFSVTSTASEQEIRTMLNVAHNNIATNVKANMSAKQKSILEESKIAITSLGGDAKATLDMIYSGNWKDYFTNSAPLSTAVPLSYTFRNLGDGSIANIVETDEFSISECSEKVGVPGIFDFLPLDNFSVSDISFPAETHIGDFNNDGAEDIIYNFKQGSTNQIKIGYGMMEGRLNFQPVVNNTEMPEGGWSNYETHIADLNGDGLDDIVWNRRTDENNQTYFALNNGDNSFQYSGLTEISGGGWDKYDFLSGDVDNDGADEFIWNITNDCCSNRTYVGNLSEDGTKVEIASPSDFGSVWGAYQAIIGNVNGGGEDIIFNARRGTNDTYVGLSNNDTTFSLSQHTRRPETGWGSYKVFTGFVDNNTNTDLIFTAVGPEGKFANRVYVSLSRGDGTFDTSIGPQDHPRSDSMDWQSYLSFVGDVDGDGIDDIIWTNQEVGDVSSKVFVALGTSSGRFDYSPVPQDNPFLTTWAQFNIYLMDINGDTRKDLIWIKPGSTTELYVALAK